FSTPESSWGNVRDTIAVQGGGTRFPTGQMNRVKAEAEAPAVDPDSWQTSDVDSIRTTLQQVVQALAQVELRRALREALGRSARSAATVEAAFRGAMANIPLYIAKKSPNALVFGTDIPST
ncbi:MAG: hypothetical protein V4641_27835, partial [Pseudomonadota bacterium]